MPDDVRNKMYSLGTMPWHEKAFVGQDGQNLIEVAELVGHMPMALQKVLIRIDPEDEESEVIEFELEDQRSITRGPIEGDPYYRNFGFVSKDYNFVPPSELIPAINEAVEGRPVETFGYLGLGEESFISYARKMRRILDDEYVDYLFIDINYAGGANHCHFTPVRPVCRNTVKAGRLAASVTFRVDHRQPVLLQMKNWIQTQYTAIEAQADAVHDAMEHLSTVRVTKDSLDALSNLVYPDPSPPENKDDEKEARAFERRSVAAKNDRAIVIDLFNGKGKGMDLKATKGTAYGFLQAVVEKEDWITPPKSFGLRDIPGVTGRQAKFKDQAFDLIMDWSVA